MKKTDIKFLVLALFLSIPLVLPFFKGGIPETDDSVYRVVKAAKYYLALHQGQIPPRWIGDVNQGLGEPSFIFNHPLTYLFSSVLHIFFNTSIVASLNILYVASVFSLAILMYVFLRMLFSPFASFIGSALYIWSPYRFMQLYLRGTIEELIALVFVPLNLIFIYKIVQQKRLSWIFGAFSLGAIILAHFLISYIFIPILVLFFIALYAEKLKKVQGESKFLQRVIDFEKREKILTRFLLYLLFGFSLASFALLPAVFEKKYVQFNQTMYTIYQTGFLPLVGFISTTWKFDFHSIRVGISYYWLALFLIFREIGNKKIDISKNYLLWFFLFVFTYPWLLIIQTPLASFLWNVIPLIKNVNFPFIFLTATYFAAASIVAFLANRLKDKRFPLIVFMLAIVFNISNAKAKNYLNFPDEYLYVYQGITSAFDEFIPIAGEKRRADLEIIKYPTFFSTINQVNISVLEKLYHKVKIKISANEPGMVVFNNYYFPGWEVVIDGEKQPIIITRGDEVAGGVEKGLLAVAIPPGNHEVLFSFKETPLRKFVNLLSLFSFIILSFIFFIFLVSPIVKRY